MGTALSHQLNKTAHARADLSDDASWGALTAVSPDVITHTLLRFLTTTDCVALCVLNRPWHRFASSDAVWHEYYKHTFLYYNPTRHNHALQQEQISRTGGMAASVKGKEAFSWKGVCAAECRLNWKLDDSPLVCGEGLRVVNELGTPLFARLPTLSKKKSAATDDDVPAAVMSDEECKLPVSPKSPSSPAHERATASTRAVELSPVCELRIRSGIAAQPRNLNQIAITKRGMWRGQHSLTVRLDRVGWGTSVGLCKQFQAPYPSQLLLQLLQDGSVGKFVGNEIIAAGRVKGSLKDGDVVRMDLDIEDGTLTWTVNQEHWVTVRHITHDAVAHTAEDIKQMAKQRLKAIHDKRRRALEELKAKEAEKEEKEEQEEEEEEELKTKGSKKDVTEAAREAEATARALSELHIVANAGSASHVLAVGGTASEAMRARQEDTGSSAAAPAVDGNGSHAQQRRQKQATATATATAAALALGAGKGPLTRELEELEERAIGAHADQSMVDMPFHWCLQMKVTPANSSRRLKYTIMGKTSRRKRT